MAPPKRILVVSLSKALTGHPISEVIQKDWTKVNDETRARFDSVGFDVDPSNLDAALEAFGKELSSTTWDAVLLGWCMRGYPERTVIFEKFTNVCMRNNRSIREGLIFCTGPTDLTNATLRTFPA